MAEEEEAKKNFEKKKKELNIDKDLTRNNCC